MTLCRATSMIHTWALMIYNWIESQLSHSSYLTIKSLHPLTHPTKIWSSLCLLKPWYKNPIVEFSWVGGDLILNSTVRVLAPHHLLISESLPSSKDIAQLIAGLPLSLLRGAQVNMGEPYSWQLLDLIANCWRLIVAQSWTSNADSVSYFSCRSVLICCLMSTI